MPQCQAVKADKTQCKGTAKKGNKYCSYHQKKYAANITHGRKALPELLGIPNNKHMTFEEFYAAEKPYELTKEIAYARTLLVELRESYENNRPDVREQLCVDFATLGTQDLTEAGMPPEQAQQVMDIIKGRLNNVVTAYYGPSLPVHAEEVKEMRTLLETTSKICERAKKIADGITLNVEFKNVGLYLVKFTREIIFRYIKEPERRAQIVQHLRGMNLTGLATTGYSPEEETEEVYA